MKPLYMTFGFDTPKPALYIGLLMVVVVSVNLYWGFGPRGAFPTHLPGTRADRNNPFLFWTSAVAAFFVLLCAIAVMISASNALLTSAS